MIADTTVRAGGADVQLLQTDDGNAYELHLVVPILMFLPAGPNQLMPIHGATIRVGMNKEVAEQAARSLTEGAEALKLPPGSSGLVVPGNPNEVDQLAQEMKRFGG